MEVNANGSFGNITVDGSTVYVYRVEQFKTSSYPYYRQIAYGQAADAIFTRVSTNSSGTLWGPWMKVLAGAQTIWTGQTAGSVSIAGQGAAAANSKGIVVEFGMYNTWSNTIILQFTGTQKTSGIGGYMTYWDSSKSGRMSVLDVSAQNVNGNLNITVDQNYMELNIPSSGNVTASSWQTSVYIKRVSLL